MSFMKNLMLENIFLELIYFKINYIYLRKTRDLLVYVGFEDKNDN